MIVHVGEVVHRIYPFAMAFSFVIIYIAEHVHPQQTPAGRKHDLQNIAVGLINLLAAAVGGYYLQQWLLYASKHFEGFISLLPQVLWLKLLMGFIVVDLFMYWWHRANHEWVFLWRFHRFHHLDPVLNTTSAIRFHIVEILLSYVLRFTVFPLLGIDATIILIYSIIFFPVIVFHHSNVRIAANIDIRFRALLVTPIMHRIHHSKVVVETNSNYGSVFPYWDYLFGSYRSKPKGVIEFGVD